jgi:hypothetical protein
MREPVTNPNKVAPPLCYRPDNATKLGMVPGQQRPPV